MADATPGVTAADADPDRIEREMEQTRESITAKVSALETQVLGTIQTATSTISDTVQAVKETVTTAPTAVKETVQEAVAAAREAVKETLVSVTESVTAINLGECVGNNPAAALSVSAAAGFITGYLLFGAKDARPLMARGSHEPAPEGRTVTSSQVVTPHSYAASSVVGPSRPGIFAGLWAVVGQEVEQLARQALSTTLSSLKQSINEQLPRLVDGAVQNVASRVPGTNGMTRPGYTPTVSGV